MFPRSLLRRFVAGIGVANDTEAGVVIQYALNFARCHLGAVSHGYLSGMQ